METHPETCQEVLALLSDYLDLELPPEACDQIDGAEVMQRGDGFVR